MAAKSAGILLYRFAGSIPEVLLVHPGGPFFAGKDTGVWTIPKGEYAEEEDPLAAARRELAEETGLVLSGDAVFYPLQPVVQKGGKQVIVWAVAGELDAATIRSNTFELEWPRGSGRFRTFPEVDKVGWFGFEEARKRINERQAAFIDELEVMLLRRR